ncbi:ribosomal protein S18-alanine N-acetyltransferase [Rodentibacter caecimuris]|uniref:[Ribosomal protein bS18]-alanine N-acetyltransferase n=1 Tax=Rodentibacter caecimuris TaxID=1796644 RepID=A0ABX3KW70_9PAST|nr:ribosomal-protein-alanine N-acetyltransferase [Rodentibacter heylii]
MINISRIEEKDFARLYEIEQQAHLIPWSFGTLKNNQGERYLNFKVSYLNGIVGFVICQCVLDEATLFNVAIAPDFQRKGLGRKLLNHLIQQLAGRGIATLWLEVRESNFSALQLYEELGFNQVDIRKNYYPLPNGKRENAVVMACYLQ